MWVVIENDDWAGDGRIVAQGAGDAVQGVGEAEVKPDRARASEGDIHAARDGAFHLGLVGRKFGEFRTAGGGVEAGEVEGHREKMPG